MRCVFLLLILVGSLTSCSVDEKTPSTDYLEIDIATEEIVEQINLSDFATDCKTIQLETSRHCIIKKISKIDFFENKIAILDTAIDQILFFNRNGKFISKIHKIGKGPDEYLMISDFFIDDRNIVNVISGKEIKLYKTNGDFIESKSLPFHVAKAFHCSDSLIILRRSWSNYIEGFTDSSEHKIAVTDINYENFISHLQFDLRNWDVVTPDHLILFSKFKETVFYYELFNDTIYAVNKTGTSPYYYFNFGQDKVPEQYYELKRSELFSKLRERQRIATSPKDFYRTNRFIYCTYIFDGNLIYVLMDTKSNKIIQAKKIVNDLNNLPFVSPIAKTENQLVYIISAIDQLEDETGFIGSILNSDLNDNPVLMMVKLKN